MRHNTSPAQSPELFRNTVHATRSRLCGLYSEREFCQGSRFSVRAHEPKAISSVKDQFHPSGLLTSVNRGQRRQSAL
jgi:hypothetical protein